VKQWAALGRHDNVSVREWACKALSTNADRVHAQLEESLGILDTRWDDARAFALHFYEHKTALEQWSPERLIALCDHLHPAVQRLGQDLLARQLKPVDSLPYLLQLSQHPSTTIQQYVSEWLVGHFDDDRVDAESFNKMEPFFLSVLSRVNKSRVLKGRVQAFLQIHAMRSKDHALLVAKLYRRCVLTVAICDKAHYVDGLRALHERYPDINGVANTIQSSVIPMSRRPLRGTTARSAA
jgi:cellulose synthase operon protein C